MAAMKLGVSVFMKSLGTRLVAIAGAVTFVASAPAAAAVQAQQSTSYSPWAALSALAAPASSQALCGAAASTAATAAQSGTPGCVLPATDAPAPVAPAHAAVPVAETGTTAGLGVIPLIAGLAVLAGAVALLLGKNGNDSITARPISPA